MPRRVSRASVVRVFRPREVGVHHFRMAAKQQLSRRDHRLLGVSPGAVGVEFRWEVGFEDRLQHQHRCCHADPIPQG